MTDARALAQTIRLFEEHAEAYERRFMGHPPYVETYARFSRLLPKNARILDAACGPGNIARYLLAAASGRTLHGIDLSPGMIALATQNNPAATFEVMDCRHIAVFGQSTFNAIVAGFCFPYLTADDVNQFMKDAHYVLQTDGLIYVSAIEGHDGLSDWQRVAGQDSIYMQFYRAGELASALESAGFEMVDIERKPFEAEGEPTMMECFLYARAK